MNIKLAPSPFSTKINTPIVTQIATTTASHINSPRYSFKELSPPIGGFSPKNLLIAQNNHFLQLPKKVRLEKLTNVGKNTIGKFNIFLHYFCYIM